MRYLLLVNEGALLEGHGLKYRVITALILLMGTVLGAYALSCEPLKELIVAEGYAINELKVNKSIMIVLSKRPELISF